MDYAPNLSDFYDDADQVKIRTQITADNARSRHDDWDATVTGHKWTEEQKQEVEFHEGDAAELAYTIAKDASTVSAEQLYDGDGGPAPEPADPDSPEALYDGK